MKVKFLSCIVICALCGTRVTFAANRYKDWIEKEVTWIASKREITEFKALKTDAEREVFISSFWKRRDPTPGTERNEYKEEHYKRWEFAKKRFSEGVPGWRTDRGRVYILHGPPDQIDYSTADRIRDQESEIWTYFSMPSATYSKGRMVLVFEPTAGVTQQSLTLGESRTAREKGQEIYRRGGTQVGNIIRNAVRYRLVSAGPPGSVNNRGLDVPLTGIGEYARYTEDIMRPPGELLDLESSETARQAESREELRAEIRSEVYYDHMPLSMSSQTFYFKDTGRINVSWQVPFSEIQFQEQGQTRVAKLDVMCQMSDGSGTVVDEFFKVVDLVYGSDELKEKRDKTFHYLNEFVVDEPGTYRLSSVVRDVHSRKMGSAIGSTEVQDVGDQIALSDLVVSSTVVPSETAIMGRDLVTGEWQVVPESDGSFGRQDSLVLFFKIYNAESDADTAQPDVVVNYDFLHDGEVFRTSGPRRLVEFNEEGLQTITFSSIIELSDFTPGDYIVQVNAIDLKTRKYKIGRTQFRVQ